MVHPNQSTRSTANLKVPVGTPAWITVEMIEDTLRTWQPYYDQPLTVTDALEILIHVGRLNDLLETSK